MGVPCPGPAWGGQGWGLVGVPCPGPGWGDRVELPCPGPGRGLSGMGVPCPSLGWRVGWWVPCPGPGWGMGQGVGTPCPGPGWGTPPFPGELTNKAKTLPSLTKYAGGKKIMRIENGQFSFCSAPT